MLDIYNSFIYRDRIISQISLFNLCSKYNPCNKIYNNDYSLCYHILTQNMIFYMNYTETIKEPSKLSSVFQNCSLVNCEARRYNSWGRPEDITFSTRHTCPNPFVITRKGNKRYTQVANCRRSNVCPCTLAYISGRVEVNVKRMTWN